MDCKIRITEGCYGPTVYLNDNDVSADSELKRELINRLLQCADSLGAMEIQQIADMIIHNSNSLYIEEESSEATSCDQCGHWGGVETYLIVDEKEYTGTSEPGS